MLKRAYGSAIEEEKVGGEKMYFYCCYADKKQISETYKNIEFFIYGEEMKNILNSFEINSFQSGVVTEDIGTYLKISDRWDYRNNQSKTSKTISGEKARWLITDDDITSEQRDIVLRSVEGLGLVGCTNPVRDEYDYILALGGARYSCLYRSKHAIELTRKMKTFPKGLIFLSGGRFVDKSERTATDTYAPTALTEYDLMNSVIEKILGLPIEAEEKKEYSNPNRNYAIRRYDSNEKMQIISLSAYSSDPEVRRANSADTFKFFLERIKPGKKSRILLVTSEIYVPYQQMEAIRTLALPEGLLVDTVGFPNMWGQKQTGMRNASNYLQEIRSTLQAIDRFIKKYPI